MPPDVTILISPTEPNDATGYAPLAPGTAQASAMAQVALRFDITNNEKATITVTKIELAIDPPPVPPTLSFAVNIVIGPGQFGRWWSETQDELVIAPPKAVKATVTFKGYPLPTVVTRVLAPHVNLVKDHGKDVTGYLFPAQTKDLEPGELWQGQSAAHDAGTGGMTLFSHELVVVGYDTSHTEWNHLRADGATFKREDHRAWEKPVYAMADGEVMTYTDSEKDNDVLLEPPADKKTDWPGNSVQIWHGKKPGIVVYGHLRQGTIKVKAGQTVSAGDELGLVGNSGPSTKPSLLLQSYDTDLSSPLPITFRETLVCDRSAVDPGTLKGPWVTAAGQGLPAVPSLIYPAPEPPLPPIRKVGGWFAEVDPLSRVISMSLYATLTKPRPPVSRVREEMASLMRGLATAERRLLTDQLKALKGYVDAIDEMLGKG